MMAFEALGPESSQGIYVLKVKEAETRAKGSSAPKRILGPNARNFRWKGDAMAFLFDRPAPPGKDDDDASTLWVGDLRTHRCRRIAIGWMGAWSPDGEQIAFVRGHALHVLSLHTGKARTVFRSHDKHGKLVTDPVWSPDGTRIIFSGGDGRLWSVPVRGGPARPLTLLSSRKEDMEPAISRDGRRVLFVRGYYGKTRSVEGFPLMLTHQLLQLDLRTGAESEITPRVEGRSDTSPQWLAEPGRFAFIRNGQLAFASCEGRHSR